MTKKKKGLTIAAGLLLVVLLIAWSGVGETVKLISQMRLRYLALACLFSAIETFLWSIRWQILLKQSDIRIPFIKVLEATLIGIFVNNVTPGARGGGEPVRMYLIKKRSESSYGKIFATIATDRMLDAVPIVIFTIIAFWYALDLGTHLVLVVLLVSVIIVVSVILLSILFSLNERLAMGLLMKLFRLLRRIFPKRLEDKEEQAEELIKTHVQDFRKTFVTLSKNKPALISSTTVSFMIWTSALLRTYFVFFSLNYPLALHKVLMVQMAAMAVGLISIIPGGIGITEAIFSALYLSLAIDKTLAVTATMVDRTLSFWIPTLTGALIATHMGIRLTEDG
ncbi:lysylphosphatidylglycerol synthase transmembrane domain-containing protein [Thermococcus sp.]